MDLDYRRELSRVHSCNTGKNIVLRFPWWEAEDLLPRRNKLGKRQLVWVGCTDLRHATMLEF